MELGTAGMTQASDALRPLAHGAACPSLGVGPSSQFWKQQEPGSACPPLPGLTRAPAPEQPVHRDFSHQQDPAVEPTQPPAESHFSALFKSKTPRKSCLAISNSPSSPVSLSDAAHPSLAPKATEDLMSLLVLVSWHALGCSRWHFSMSTPTPWRYTQCSSPLILRCPHLDPAWTPLSPRPWIPLRAPCYHRDSR